jgi:hypothetical protein
MFVWRYHEERENFLEKNVLESKDIFEAKDSSVVFKGSCDPNKKITY